MWPAFHARIFVHLLSILYSRTKYEPNTSKLYIQKAAINQQTNTIKLPKKARISAQLSGVWLKIMLLLLEVLFSFCTKDRWFHDFFRMMCVCVYRNSLFNMKQLCSKNANVIETCLICSASINYVGLNTFKLFYCPSIAIFVTITT